MDSVLTFTTPDSPFILFSPSHITVLVLLFLTSLALYILRKDLNEKSKQTIRYTLAFILFFQELFIQGWNIASGTWSADSSLPLHLCNVTALLCGIMLLNRSYALYEVAFFWGMVAAVQALLTPDLGMFAFPHVIFYRFFITHGAIVLACLYMTFVEGYRPQLVSIGKTVLFSNVYMVAIAVVNHFTGGNYMYICAKPSGASLMDYMGPWPWYILFLEAVGILLMLLCYVPFVIADLVDRRKKWSQPIRSIKL
ncbi:TIGR02206 family membrane protein [Heliobacillus mobilis]|uniref:TIGR02206 family membrane protein n=1 Tax=Heliobacterium mobile TaxID=28064 RepID=A0A6I3SIV4_HELMO|nr:TIGR02206 family membrane protein [Heliobacterium mobile]MTV48715.1 TIGR02206 family membrane protein [Heliobacterium mobile]